MKARYQSLCNKYGARVRYTGYASALTAECTGYSHIAYAMMGGIVAAMISEAVNKYSFQKAGTGITRGSRIIRKTQAIIFAGFTLAGCGTELYMHRTDAKPPPALQVLGK